MSKILVLDNYDSFTYNLVHLLQEVGESDITVVRNDKITVNEAARFEKIILSPGPGLPNEAGVMPLILSSLSSTHPILGVCLGHQAIGERYGAKLRNLTAPVHGKSTPLSVVDLSDPVLRGLPNIFEVGRYHSWVVDRSTLPDTLIVTGIDPSGEIMSMRHKSDRVYGVQFHPESILTQFGKEMLTNFLEEV